MPARLEPIDYVARWRRTVLARREQHDAVLAAQGRTTNDYWARRAEDYQRFGKDAGSQEDPFLKSVLRHLRPGDTVLDVGAGTGRHGIPLARHARLVIAVDPSQAMLAFLREEIASQGLENVEVVEGAWPEVAERVPQVDIAISAHVLYPIEDAVPFLRALDGRATRACLMQLMVLQPWFDRLALWEAVHGEPRLLQPTATDAVNLLHQLGCYADVEMAWVTTPRFFDNLDDAIERLGETVAVGEDPARRGRLREALAEQLQTAAGGQLVLAPAPYPLATISWQAGELAG